MVQSCHQKALGESLVKQLRSAAAVATVSFKQAVVPLKDNQGTVSPPRAITDETGPELDPDVCGRAFRGSATPGRGSVGQH